MDPERYLNPGELADKIAVVQVDGQSVEVPYAELVAGYSRQADYTKKSQAVAEERKAMEGERSQMENAVRLYEQLQNDPEGTVNLLNEQLGIKTVQPGQEAAPVTQPPASQDSGFDDPELAELKQLLLQQNDQIRQLQARNAVDSEAKQLTDQFPDANLTEVIAYAAANKFPSEGGLEQAYKAMMFDKAKENPPEPVAAEPLSELDQLLEAKRAIPQPPPTSRPPGEAAPPSTGDPFFDAWRESERELT